MKEDSQIESEKKILKNKNDVKRKQNSNKRKNDRQIEKKTFEMK